MTTTTRKPTAAQMADQVKDHLDFLALWYPRAEQEARRVLNLTVPLANAINAGLVKQLTPKGRDQLHEGHYCLGVIRDLMDQAAYDDMSATGSWTTMWDWTRAPEGVAFV